MSSSSVADSCWTAPRARTVISCGERVTEALDVLTARFMQTSRVSGPDKTSRPHGVRAKRLSPARRAGSAGLADLRRSLARFVGGRHGAKARRCFAVLGISIGTAAAQEVNARAALQASLKAMGGETLKTIQYTGVGWSSLIGQTYGLDEDWPHFEVSAYTRAIDYDARWSREDYTRRQGNYPTLGRVPMPEQRMTAIVSGSYAWDMRDNTPVPLTRPYLDGVLVQRLAAARACADTTRRAQAGLAATDATAITLPIVGASDFGLSQFGRKVTIVSFSLLGKYTMNVTINDQNLVELVDTWFPNPVYGDMDYEMRYTQYKDFGGVKFPTLFHVHQGDPRLNPAHNYYEYRITAVTPNAPVATMPVPEAVRTATVPPVRVESQKLAEGVWLLGGGTHNSMLVEFKDYVAVVEAPNNEERSLAVIAEATRLVPGKQIRYLINTHHHFDHAGGLRTFLSQGTTIVTHESNKQVPPGHHVLSRSAHAATRSNGEIQPDVHDQPPPGSDRDRCRRSAGHRQVRRHRRRAHP